jgi:hypothetical protein
MQSGEIVLVMEITTSFLGDHFELLSVKTVDQLQMGNFF